MPSGFLQVTSGWTSPPSSPSGAQKTITLTLLGSQPVTKTVQDVANMPFTEFAALYAVGHTCATVKPWSMASLNDLKHSIYIWYAGLCSEAWSLPAGFIPAQQQQH